MPVGRGPFDQGLGLAASIAQGAQSFVSAYQGARNAQYNREVQQQQLQLKADLMRAQMEALRAKNQPIEVDLGNIWALNQAMSGGLIPEAVGNKLMTRAGERLQDNLHKNPGAMPLVMSAVSGGQGRMPAPEYAPPPRSSRPQPGDPDFMGPVQPGTMRGGSVGNFNDLITGRSAAGPSAGPTNYAPGVVQTDIPPGGGSPTPPAASAAQPDRSSNPYSGMKVRVTPQELQYAGRIAGLKTQEQISGQKIQSQYDLQNLKSMNDQQLKELEGRLKGEFMERDYANKRGLQSQKDEAAERRARIAAEARSRGAGAGLKLTPSEQAAMKEYQENLKTIRTLQNVKGIDALTMTPEMRSAREGTVKQYQDRNSQLLQQNPRLQGMISVPQGSRTQPQGSTVKIPALPGGGKTKTAPAAPKEITWDGNRATFDVNTPVGTIVNATGGKAPGKYVYLGNGQFKPAGAQ